MSKIFAFDIDGTFLNDKHEVQQSHIDALIKAKEAGHELVLSSGRPYRDMLPVLAQVPEGLFQYLVCNNGAYIVNLENGERILDKEVANEMVAVMEEQFKYAKFGFAVHTLEDVYRGNTWSEDVEAPEWYANGAESMALKSKLFVSWEEAKKHAMNEKITQLSILGYKDEIKAASERVLSGNHEADVVIAGDIYMDINPKGISKMVGLKKLVEILDMSTEDIVAFGDSNNDIQMLKGVGLGIAMGQATPEAKAAADITIGTNNTSAIADKVLELI